MKVRVLRRLFCLLLGSLAQSAQPQEEEFVRRWNAFAGQWNKLAGDIMVGVFDVAKTKRLSKLFRELEGCGMWPRPEVKK